MCLDSERIINYILWLESIPPRPIAQFVNLFIGKKLCCDLAKLRKRRCFSRSSKCLQRIFAVKISALDAGQIINMIFFAFFTWHIFLLLLAKGDGAWGINRRCWGLGTGKWNGEIYFMKSVVNKIYLKCTGYIQIGGLIGLRCFEL